MKILGLEFAAWNVPLHRRIQTLTVALFILFLASCGLVGIIILLSVFFSPYYFLAVAYLVWMYYDWNTPSQGGRSKQWIRYSTLWNILASYFPIKLVKTANLATDKNYMFAFHPHGIGGFGCIINFLSEGTGFAEFFPGIKTHVLTLAGNFRFPVSREILLMMGFCAVTKESIEWILSKQATGNSVVIVVGGAAEALDARPGEATLTLKNRKGFVKMAIKNGASLVPVYSFGENDLYNQVDNPVGSRLRTIQNKLSKAFGFSMPLFNGRGIFNYTLGILPHRRPIFTVVGEPLDVTKNEHPSQEEIDKVHGEYLQRLTQLYNKFREKYGNPEKDIVFI